MRIARGVGLAMDRGAQQRETACFGVTVSGFDGHMQKALFMQQGG